MILLLSKVFPLFEMIACIELVQVKVQTCLPVHVEAVPIFQQATRYLYRWYQSQNENSFTRTLYTASCSCKCSTIDEISCRYNLWYGFEVPSTSRYHMWRSKPLPYWWSLGQPRPCKSLHGPTYGNPQLDYIPASSELKSQYDVSLELPIDFLKVYHSSLLSTPKKTSGSLKRTTDYSTRYYNVYDLWQSNVS